MLQTSHDKSEMVEQDFPTNLVMLFYFQHSAMVGKTPLTGNSNLLFLRT